MTPSPGQAERRLGPYEWRPTDEGPDAQPFVHRVVAYSGPLPRGPIDWLQVCRWLAALGRVSRGESRLRHIEGHEEAPRRRGRPPKASPVR